MSHGPCLADTVLCLGWPMMTHDFMYYPGREHLWVARSRVNLLVRGSSLGCASAFSRGSKSVDNQNLGVQLASQMAE